MNITHFIHSSSDRRLAVVNNAAMNMSEQITLWLCFRFSVVILPEVELLDYEVILCFIFLNRSCRHTPASMFKFLMNHHTVSTAAASFYIPTNRVQGLHFLHILLNTYFLFFFFFWLFFLFCFDINHPTGCEWYILAVSVLISLIISDADHLYTSLEKHLFKSFVHIIIGLFCCRFVGILYIF